MMLAVEILTLCLMTMILAGLAVVFQYRSGANQQTFTVFLVVLAIHACISIWNGVWGPIFGAERDAYVFHVLALEKINVPLPPGFDGVVPIYVVGYIYSVYLKGLYWLTTESWAISCLMSTIAFAVLCIMTSELYKDMTADYPVSAAVKQHSLLNIVLLIGMLPTALLLTSFTMREVYQMLFLASIVFCTLKLWKNISLKILAVLISVMTLFSSLHPGAIVFIAVYLFVLIVLILKSLVGRFFKYYVNININIKTNKYFYIAISLIGLIPIILFVEYLAYPTFSNFIYKAVDVGKARAFYGATDISGGFLSMNLYFLVSFFNYYVRPFPWEITGVTDLVTILENILRIYVIVQIIRLREHITTDVGFILFVAFAMDALWALGTLNWGTAQRHHIVVWPLFVVTYYGLLTRMNGRAEMASTPSVETDTTKTGFQIAK